MFRRSPGETPGPEKPGTSKRFGRGSESLLFLFGFTLVAAHTLWLLHPVGTGTRYIVEYGFGDSLMHVWNLWWIYQAVMVEHTSPYFTTYGGFPGGVSLTYHSLILPLGILSIPLFEMGLEPSRIYLLWLYVFPLLGYAGTFALLHELRAPPWGRVAGGCSWE